MLDTIISDKQKWNNQELSFEPDSSPEAWSYYKEVYKNAKFKEEYDFTTLHFYIPFLSSSVSFDHRMRIGDKWANFVDEPKSEQNNRLYALQKNAKRCSNKAGKLHFVASRRLGGECDFNFNKKKIAMFREIINNDQNASKETKDYAFALLKTCEEKHHTLLNFSLMESTGNMQGFKGDDRFDRLDRFVYELDLYYKELSNSIINNAANKKARNGLTSFLKIFTDIYHYCEEIYLIEDKKFIEKIIQQGSEPIENTYEIIRYMHLALEFWKKKKENIMW